MRIFLVGFMGSGKTTLGKKFASYLGYEFIDLDAVIEKSIGKRISDYFSEFGEAAFRELESRMLRETDFPENAVIAAGGGTPCFNDNMKWMNENGAAIYLQIPPRMLASRLEHSSGRPLIRHLRGEELVAFIEKKLHEREPFYSQAKYIVTGSDLSAEKLASATGLGQSK